MTPFVFELVHDTPLHVGIDGDLAAVADSIPSDTLWGALCATAHAINRGMELFQQTGQGGASSALAVSSAFPRVRNIRFFARPFVPVSGRSAAQNPGDAVSDSIRLKKIKSVRFVSEKIFANLLVGNTPPQPSRSDGFLATKEEESLMPHTIFISSVLPSNTLDRLTDNAVPFERAEIVFNTAADCGTWFIATIDEKHIGLLTGLIEALGARGIGGERGIGKGYFHLRGKPAPYSGSLDFSPGSHTRFATISRFIPREDEVRAGILHGAAYDTVVRGGWSNGFRNRKSRMCREGSTFPTTATPPYGCTRDVGSESWKKSGGHPVLLFGGSLPIFYTPSQKEKAQQ